MLSKLELQLDQGEMIDGTFETSDFEVRKCSFRDCKEKVAKSEDEKGENTVPV